MLWQFDDSGTYQLPGFDLTALAQLADEDDSGLIHRILDDATLVGSQLLTQEDVEALLHDPEFSC